MKNIFKNKNVLIMGMGKSGKSAFELLKNKGAFCYVFDDRKQVLKDFYNRFDCNVIEKVDEYSIKIMDFVIISPGISIFDERVKLAKLFGIKVLSELELGSYFLKGKIVGITGSNGKTTISSLVYSILKNANKNCVLCGNIGNPLTSNILPYKAIYVVEMSSFQLESLQKIRTNVCAISNITENHIDRHLTFKNYCNAKCNIFKNCKKNDNLILNFDDEILKKLSKKIKNLKVTNVSIKEENDGFFEKNGKIFKKNGKKIKFLFEIEKTKLVGVHNLSNILMATAICKKLRIKDEIIKLAIENFEPIKHRIQFVKNVNGVEYYNDSKSTTPESTITAINSFEKKPIVLMLGGSDKNLKFDVLAKKIAQSDIKFVVVCGETSKKIVTSLKKAKFEKFVVAKNFEKAFEVANKKSTNGDVVLLSPASASFDFFKCYEERGDEFEKLVQNLETEKD